MAKSKTRASPHLLHARDVERARIARELHDGALQTLVEVKIDLEMLVSQAEVPPAAATAAEAARLADKVRACIKEIRAILADLEPPDLEGTDAWLALQRFIDGFRDRHTIQVRRHLDPLPPTLGREHKLSVYRILQEALNNVAKHSRASEVSVELSVNATDVELRVADNGRGFTHSPRAGRRRGLRNIQDRAAALGGSATIDSAPGNGAVVTARIPLEGRAPETGVS